MIKMQQKPFAAVKKTKAENVVVEKCEFWPHDDIQQIETTMAFRNGNFGARLTASPKGMRACCQCSRLRWSIAGLRRLRTANWSRFFSVSRMARSSAGHC